MRSTDLVAIVAGVVMGMTGLALIGVLEAMPCSSMAMVFDNAHESALHGDGPGFDCERWPTLAEGLLMEWAPSIVLLGLSGAMAARIGEPSSRWLGLVTGGLVALVAFALRDHNAFFGPGLWTRWGPWCAAAVLAGACAGWVGGWLAQRGAGIKRLG